MGFLDTVKNLLGKNASKVETAIDKAGDLVDKKTGNKYQGIVDKAQDAAKKAVKDQTAQPYAQPVPPTQQSGQVPPASPPPSQ